MIVAVTGATGFLGRHVVKELARQPGLQVVAVSRSGGNIPDASPNVRSVSLDIAAPPPDAYDRMGRPEVVVHLAWAGLSNFRALAHFDDQLAQQYRFLKSLVEAGLPSLLSTGTCLEYGMRSGALSEDMTPDPHLAYPYAKDSLRRQLTLLRSTKEFQLTWARLFYVYGPGQPASTLYSQLTAAVQRGERSFRMSRGEQLRDYLPVAEMARYLARLTLEAPGSGIVNVGSGRPVSVRSLVESWLREMKWEMSLELGHYPYPDYEPMAFWADTRRLRALLPEQQPGGAGRAS
jgi:nucleoside-diphosphate-sugar epimerase